MIKKILGKLSVVVCLSLYISHAYAGPGYIHVSDMSQVHYQLVGDGNVYFRNLNTFNNTATGCCYAFILDTTTPYGKSAWSVILMKMATKAPLSLYVSDYNPPTSGNPATIDHLGNW
ncbi:hypothetical protein Sden_1934 [Shewanella denitrificans OS217]|jgi:hypothetical protein|uniref:Uncharacterized protein n=1 Tax=Shewanella denitrificans (strain OS217 / ATCC BAA-1090 / DSM 15013) TaxID=318161 RepID=Q12MV9_SHEDO|nr:hypothetical protein [Shewanella denitrificans]ABE55217.1 hypothetical protein Sden_1934 [Shewanella denitrificans OS217]